jgi:uncharacterized protein YigE (DUF2233 family)
MTRHSLLVRLRGRWAILGLVLGSFLPANADSPSPSSALQTVQYGGQHYVIRTVDPKKDDLRLYLKDDQGNFLRDFATLDKYVASKGGHLLFAANAGMFDPTTKPVGLLVQDGTEQSPLNLNDGTGNFFMKPNGVFLVNEKHEAHIVDASEYAAVLTPVVWATQSGPLLLNHSELHPDFIEGSANKKIRSGVGVRRDGTIVFALSAEPVNFYHFAAFFLAGQKCPNALFLDGDISAFYVPGAKDDKPHSFGPMIGVVEKAGK